MKWPARRWKTPIQQSMEVFHDQQSRATKCLNLIIGHPDGDMLVHTLPGTALPVENGGYPQLDLCAIRHPH